MKAHIITYQIMQCPQKHNVLCGPFPRYGLSMKIKKDISDIGIDNKKNVDDHNMLIEQRRVLLTCC